VFDPRLRPVLLRSSSGLKKLGGLAHMYVVVITIIIRTRDTSNQAAADRAATVIGVEYMHCISNVEERVYVNLKSNESLI
jgi:hypothetical protein